MHVNAKRLEFEAQAFAKTQYRIFGGAVIGIAIHRRDTGHRRDQHDLAAATRAHQRQHRLAQVPAAVQVHLHDTVEVFELHGGEFAGNADAGAIDDDVGRAALDGGQRHRGQHCGAVCHVHLVAGDRRRAGRFNGGDGGIGKVVVKYDDARAGRSQALARFQANAAGTAGDVDRFVGKVLHGLALWD